MSLRDDRHGRERALYKYVYAKYTHEGDRGGRSAQSRTYVKNRSIAQLRRIRREFVTESRFRRGPSLNRRSLPHRILISATVSRLSVRLSTDKKMHRAHRAAP